jgi:membrane protease YdiL (CAAX protease family)
VLLTASVLWFRFRSGRLPDSRRLGWGATTREEDASPRWSWAAAGLVCLLMLLLITATLLGPAAQIRGPLPSRVELGAVVFLVPVAEETFFRGALLLSLRRQLGAVGATLVVSILFGLLHHGQGQLPTMLVASLALCAITLLTRTLLWAVLLHGTWNALTMVVRMPPMAERFLVTGAVTALVLALVGIRIYKSSQEQS